MFPSIISRQLSKPPKPFPYIQSLPTWSQQSGEQNKLFFFSKLAAFKRFLWFVSSFLCWILCLGHQEFWMRADPPATAIPSRCWGHEDLPHPVWVPSPAGLQELHPPHHSPGNGHPAAGRQPQQSLGYNNHVLGYTTPCSEGYIYTPQTIRNCLCCYVTHLYKSLWRHVTSHLMFPPFPLE